MNRHQCFQTETLGKSLLRVATAERQNGLQSLSVTEIYRYERILQQKNKQTKQNLMRNGVFVKQNPKPY